MELANWRTGTSWPVAQAAVSVVGMSEVARVARQFATASEFTTSPLYRALSPVVANNERLVRLAARRRAGQYPTFLFFGAVHALLLSSVRANANANAGADHDLARYYPSIVGAQALPPQGAGPALEAFCAEHEPELAHLIETRLVQTNHVQRSLGLRLGLAAIRRHTTAAVHLVEIGASAGLNLRHDRYGYRVGGGRFGDTASPVQVSAQWLGGSGVPDLDAVPRVLDVTGVDLHPLDAANVDHRRWLEALVWPENRRQAELLSAALDVVVADPPRLLAGDAVDLCPALDAELPADEPVVVFHSATRIHVPVPRQAAFDAAIADLGRARPLYWLALEDGVISSSSQPPSDGDADTRADPDADPDVDPNPNPHPHPNPHQHQRPGRPGPALTLRTPDGKSTTLAVVDGHLAWVDPLHL